MLFFPEVFRNENQKRFSGFPRGFSVYNTDYDGISRVVRGIRRFNAVKVLSPIWALLISMLAYGGSMRYAAVNLFTVPFDPLNAFILSLTVNARYLFCNTGMLKRFSSAGKCRPFLFSFG